MSSWWESRRAAPEAPAAALRHAPRRPRSTWQHGSPRSPICMRRERSPTRSSPRPRRGPRRRLEAGSPPSAPNSPGWTRTSRGARRSGDLGRRARRGSHALGMCVRSLRAPARGTRPGRRRPPAHDVQLPPPCRRSRSSALIGVWSVLSMFPATQEIARAFLASSAVLAVIAGLALTTPARQPRLGGHARLHAAGPARRPDHRRRPHRHRGRDLAELHGARRPTRAGGSSSRTRDMVSTTLVNRSVDDPRRLVTVELPVRLTALARGRAPRRRSRPPPTRRRARACDLDVQVGDADREDGVAQRRRVRAVRRRRLADRERDPRARARRARRGRAASRR